MKRPERRDPGAKYKDAEWWGLEERDCRLCQAQEKLRFLKN